MDNKEMSSRTYLKIGVVLFPVLAGLVGVSFGMVWRTSAATTVFGLTQARHGIEIRSLDARMKRITSQYNKIDKSLLHIQDDVGEIKHVLGPRAP